MMKINNTVRMQSGTYRVMVGKVFYNGFWYVSKVHYNNGVLGMYISEFNKTGMILINDFEVLTCQPLIRKCLPRE